MRRYSSWRKNRTPSAYAVHWPACRPCGALHAQASRATKTAALRASPPPKAHQKARAPEPLTAARAAALSEETAQAQASPPAAAAKTGPSSIRHRTTPAAQARAAASAELRTAAGRVRFADEQVKPKKNPPKGTAQHQPGLGPESPVGPPSSGEAQQDGDDQLAARAEGDGPGVSPGRRFLWRRQRRMHPRCDGRKLYKRLPGMSI